MCTSIMRTFAGEWYTKHNYLNDMSLRKAQGFVAHAIEKVRDAMVYQEGAMSSSNERNTHLLVCNGATEMGKRARARIGTAERWQLRTFGATKNVRLKVSDITDWMGGRLPEQVLDLLELASLVYAADQCCRRTPGKRFDYGQRWRRTLRLNIAVRRPDFWARTEVRDVLCETLHFLSEDDYAFEFSQMTEPPPVQEYFDYKQNAVRESVDQVMLMSGGLDSLAGAVQQVLHHRRRLALVSHKPVEHLARRQRELVAAIGERSGDTALLPLHIAVTAHKFGLAEQDVTQRSRSFLYASLGAAVAHLFELDEIWFYENGIVSVNLPLCAQEVGGRATRTTHPQSLRGFERLFAFIFERPFKVCNGFFWHTKQDVMQVLQQYHQPDLARPSVSCSHTRGVTHSSPHCGMCSQCLSRKLAALGAAFGQDDPPEGYRKDPMVGERSKDEERILAERFIGQARAVVRMTAVGEFDKRFAGELSRVYPYLNMPTSVAAEKLFDLHLRHAQQVGAVLVEQVQANFADHWEGRLNSTCALAYVLGTAPKNRQRNAKVDSNSRPNEALGSGGGENPSEQLFNTAAVRPDGFYVPNAIVWRGREYSCTLTKLEAVFFNKTIDRLEIELRTLMYKGENAIWKERYCGAKRQRDKIAQMVSRLTTKLSTARPPIPIIYSLARSNDYVLREDTTPSAPKTETISR